MNRFVIETTSPGATGFKLILIRLNWQRNKSETLLMIYTDDINSFCSLIDLRTKSCNATSY